jgi:hypothetical protein
MYSGARHPFTLRDTIVTVGVVASAAGLVVLLGRARSYETRLDEIAALATSRQAEGRDSKTPVYYYLNRSEPESITPASERPGAEPEHPVPSEDSEVADAHFESADDQALTRIQRHERLMGAFEGQTAAHYQARRVDALTSTWEKTAEGVTERPDRELGELACKGRMCILPVAFGSEGALSEVIQAARYSAHSVGEDGGGVPLVHFMTLPSEPNGTTRGHFFFEWLEEATGEH